MFCSLCIATGVEHRRQDMPDETIPADRSRRCCLRKRRFIVARAQGGSGAGGDVSNACQILDADLTSTARSVNPFTLTISLKLGGSAAQRIRQSRFADLLGCCLRQKSVARRAMHESSVGQRNGPVSLVPRRSWTPSWMALDEEHRRRDSPVLCCAVLDNHYAHHHRLRTVST